MRTRFLISVSVLIVLLLALCWKLRWFKPASHDVSSQGSLQLAADRDSNSRVSKTERAAGETDVPKPPELDDEHWRRLVQTHKKQLTQNGPITFYGKIVDQDGQPVSGVRIELTTTAYDEGFLARIGDALKGQKISDQSFETINLVSDAEGRFSLSGKRGKYLNILAVEKEGYVSDISYRAFSYGRDFGHPPIPYTDPTNPVVFHVWRKGEAERLIRNETNVRVAETGKIYSVNLLMRKNPVASPPSDLELTVVTKQRLSPTDRGWPWSLTLRAIDGGFLETEDRFLFQAPESGYVPQIQYQSLDPQDEKWRSGFDKKKFYLQSRNGQIYAALELGLQTGPNEGLVVIEAIVNPRGSRNLEFDQTKQIKDLDQIRQYDLQTSSGDRP